MAYRTCINKFYVFPELALPAKNERPSRTLVLTIFDDMPRLDCLVFYKICAPFGEVRQEIQVTVHTRPYIFSHTGLRLFVNAVTFFI